MATENPLLQFVTYPLALGACVAICLWVLLVPLRIDQLAFGLQRAPEPGPPRPIVSSDSGPWVKHMQQALIKRGYSVGSTGADGDFNDDTMAALGTFQDNNGLVVQQQCDRQCWTALRLPGQKLPEPALLGPIVSNGAPRVKQI